MILVVGIISSLDMNMWNININRLHNYLTEVRKKCILKGQGILIFMLSTGTTMNRFAVFCWVRSV